MSNHLVMNKTDMSFFQNKFQNASKQLNKRLLKELQIEVTIVEVLNCIAIKLYKRSWSNPDTSPLNAKTRIFFSIWADNTSMSQQKIYYNIHAFKLRQFIGYQIESKKFASVFRARFKEYESEWENVSVKFGPLTLMEGWQNVNMKNLQNEILKLLNNFLKLEYLIDETLLKFKK